MNDLAGLPKVGLIGHGAWGQQHARVLRDLGCLRWVYDADPTQLVGCPERTAFIEKIWDDPRTEAVVIAAPPHAHTNLALDAIRCGKHVLIEKPMAVSALDCVQLHLEAQAAEVVLMVGHLMMFHSGFVSALAKARTLGQIEYVYSHRLQPGRVRSDVSCLWSLAPHDVSMMLAVAGLPVSVVCTGGVERQSGLADVVTATFEFRSGARGHLFVSWMHPEKSREFVVLGTRGAAIMGAHEGREPLRIELEHFLNCCRTGQLPLTDATEGLDVVRVLAACDRSMSAKGERVWL